MRKFIICIGLAAAGLSSASLANEKKAPAAGAQHELAPEVSLDELKTIVANKSAFLVDCNSEKSFAEGHIPGAINFANHEGKLTDVLPKDKNAAVIAYCGGTMCSAWEAAAKEAKAAGYTNIRHFKGGIKGWKDAKLAVETGAAQKKS